MNLPYVAGKYALLRKIASGGMAEVFLAKHIGLDGFEKLVVLKRILPHLASQREYVSMFLDEAKTAADLRHSNVVNTFEFGEDKGVYFMVMEFLHGQDLRSIYRKALQTKIEIPLKHSLGIIIDACCGLYYAHSKKDMNGQNLAIVHRDISPQNIVVTYEGETKIVDFGIAKAAHQNVETASGVLKGKYSYMSPEQALGHGADHRTDIFALGIVLYEMTTWRRLFKRDNDINTLKAVIACEIPLPCDIVSEYPVALQNIVMKALAKNKSDRFNDCDEFRIALEDFLHYNHWAHSSSRMRKFMCELFKEAIDNENNLGVVNLKEVSGSTFWSSSDSNNTISTRVEMLSTKPRVLFLLSSALGIALAVLIIVMSTRDFNVNRVDVYKPEKMTAKVELRQILPLSDVTEPLLNEIKNKSVGRLKVVVDPWAEVYLNGIKIGSTPLAAKKLPVGEYKIRLENPAIGKKINKTIIIKPEEDTLIRHVW